MENFDFSADKLTILDKIELSFQGNSLDNVDRSGLAYKIVTLSEVIKNYQKGALTKIGVSDERIDKLMKPNHKMGLLGITILVLMYFRRGGTFNVSETIFWVTEFAKVLIPIALICLIPYFIIKNNEGVSEHEWPLYGRIFLNATTAIFVVVITVLTILFMMAYVSYNSDGRRGDDY